MIIEANCIVYETFGSIPTAVEAAEALQEYVYDLWTFVSSEIYSDLYLIQNKESSNYIGACYSAANLLSGLARSLSIPTRMILMDAEGNEEHVWVEFYLNDTQHNGWVTADGTTDGYGWYDWSEFETKMGTAYNWTKPPAPTTVIEVQAIRWVYEVTGDTIEDVWTDYESVDHIEDDAADSYWTTWDDYKTVFS